MELKALLIEACNEIAEDMCHQVINNITVAVEEVARRNGDYIEHLVHRE
jgi:phenylpyruvate tautomerase PptA (4-oxalocrotonate tautomerase family)